MTMLRLLVTAVVSMKMIDLDYGGDANGGGSGDYDCDSTSLQY